jgi:hypothetical protein
MADHEILRTNPGRNDLLEFSMTFWQQAKSAHLEKAEN